MLGIITNPPYRRPNTIVFQVFTGKTWVFLRDFNKNSEKPTCSVNGLGSLGTLLSPSDCFEADVEIGWRTFFKDLFVHSEVPGVWEKATTCSCIYIYIIQASKADEALQLLLSIPSGAMVYPRASSCFGSSFGPMVGDRFHEDQLLPTYTGTCTCSTMLKKTKTRGIQDDLRSLIPPKSP